MKKYLFYTFLALCMIPAGSLKAQSGPDEEENPGGIILDKQVSEENEDGGYTITLDAYATGTKVTTITETTFPVDLMLVLDVSTSMAPAPNNDEYQCLLSTFEKLTTGDKISLLHTNTSGNANYHKVFSQKDSKCTRYRIKIGNTTYNLWYHENNNNNKSQGWYYGSGTSWNNGSGWTKYERNNADDIIYTDVKIDLLQEACRVFLDELLTKAKGKDGVAGTTDDIDIRVGYSSFCGSLKENYKIVPVLNTTEYNTLLSEINDLHNNMGSSTAPVKSLDDAYTKFSNLNTTLLNEGKTQDDINNRLKVVVMFTDGEPTNTLDDNILSASYLKSNSGNGKQALNASLYTIGIFSNPQKNISDSRWTTVTIADYMRYTSSQYPNATGSASNKRGNENTDGVQYYYEDTGAQLSEIFRTIASESSTGKSSVDLNETSVVVVDVMSNYFMLPEGVETTDIKTYTANCTGYDTDNNTFTFGTPTAQNFTLSVNEATREVDVMGFDFAANYVYEDTGKTPTEYGGKKLIIEIPIVVDPANPGGANLVTNNKALSGVYTGGEVVDGEIAYDHDSKFAGFPKPMVVKPNIVIKKHGLRRAGESATFRIERVANQNGDPYTGTDYQPFYVSLTQTKNYATHPDAINDANALIAKVKLLDYGWYRVTETSWSSWYTPEARATGYRRVNPNYPDTSSEPTIDDTYIKYGTDSDGCPYLIRYVGKETEMQISPAKTVDGEEYYSVGTPFNFVNTLIGSTTRDPEKYSEAVVINKFGTDGSSNPVNK